MRLAHIHIPLPEDHFAAAKASAEIESHYQALRQKFGDGVTFTTTKPKGPRVVTNGTLPQVAAEGAPLAE